MKLLAAIVVLLGLATVAFAQEPAPPPKSSPEDMEVVERQAKGRAGRNIRLVVITNVRRDCTSGPLPTIRLATPPNLASALAATHAAHMQDEIGVGAERDGREWLVEPSIFDCPKQR